jgi:tripartite-type tricarboxylate transporter receptor subunit TctC
MLRYSVQTPVASYPRGRKGGQRSLGRIVAIAIATAAVSWLPAAKAQEAAASYPSKAVEIVVPFAAGGTADIMARFAAKGLAEAWGKPVVVQNKAGATGAIAAEFVARAPADGYTLLFATGSTHTVNPAYRTDLTFHPVTSFTPLARIAVVPNVLVVNPQKVPVNSVAEFIAFLKARPGAINFGSSGSGGASHFAGELFGLMTETKMTHVPYRGTAPAVADLVAGNIDVVIDNISSVWPQVQQGSLRALGIATLQRSPIAPDLPTIAETVPGFEAVSWNGFVGPANMPPAIARKISDAIVAAVKAPDVTKKIEELGASAATSPGPDFAKFVGEDLARWTRVARERNLSSK